MASHALITLGAIVLAIALFSVPLVLKYQVYRPQYQHVVAGDAFLVSESISSTWCQGVDLESESGSFRSFLFESEPLVDEDTTERTVSTYRLSLPDGAQEYWGFQLPRGSSLNLSACARLPGADVNVLRGLDGLKKCLLEHEKKMRDGESSAEDSLSESESDEDTSSISSSQGVVANETALHSCSNSLEHAELQPSYRCKFPFDTTAWAHTLQHSVNETGFYYFLFSSATYLGIVPNELSVVFSIDRTHYDSRTSSGNCTSGNKCRLAIPMGSRHRVVVNMESVNGTLKSEKFHFACRPREWIFMIFYAAFLLVIFLCAFQ